MLVTSEILLWVLGINLLGYTKKIIFFVTPSTTKPTVTLFGSYLYIR